jgi:hypothetical protein
VVEIAAERPEGAHRSIVPIRGDGDDVECRADIDAGRTALIVENSEDLPRVFFWLSAMVGLLFGPSEAGVARSITFLNGIACGRRHDQVRKPPPDHVFLRARDVTIKRTATASGAPVSIPAL